MPLVVTRNASLIRRLLQRCPGHAVLFDNILNGRVHVDDVARFGVQLLDLESICPHTLFRQDTTTGQVVLLVICVAVEPVLEVVATAQGRHLDSLGDGRDAEATVLGGRLLVAEHHLDLGLLLVEHSDITDLQCLALGCLAKHLDSVIGQAPLEAQPAVLFVHGLVVNGKRDHILCGAGNKLVVTCRVHEAFESLDQHTVGVVDLNLVTSGLDIGTVALCHLVHVYDL